MGVMRAWWLLPGWAAGSRAVPRPWVRWRRPRMWVMRSRATPAGGLAVPSQIARRARRMSSSAGAVFPADQRGGGQFGGADAAAAARPAMAGSDGHGQPVMANDLAAHGPGLPRACDEADIGLALGDVADDGLGVGRGQHDLGGGAARLAGRAEGGQPGREQLPKTAASPSSTAKSPARHNPTRHTGCCRTGGAKRPQRRWQRGQPLRPRPAATSIQSRGTGPEGGRAGPMDHAGTGTSSRQAQAWESWA
jgi:hypothetical protein